ncbi:CsgG/HfaB family protein [Casimicrobium huifangae]|jgi:curli biogenesis system outer membrane secretion channel CsgG|uniref:CsgG/HfaB family protein n=1 Tax=Casimicrobium huifangae TaxID=2591109 RepID=UPI0012EC4766|nr:CsgG/HfaB family protein [Casimicrobium huifangae]HOB01596.1 CsgG/HfaB family protein [Casimicrobium huifangae]HQA33913.1 CsgG/HfaB family protein [Casimicrobium huifangae]
MPSRPVLLIAFAAIAVVALASCRQTDLGEGGSKVSGSAGPAGPKDAAKELVTCDAPIATIALAESPNGYTVLSQYQLPPTPLPLIRVMMQQSGCFRVVDRAAGLRGTIQEQELKDAGILKAETVPKKGEGIGARMTLTPSLTFSENNAGGGIAAILGMIPALRDWAGVASGVKFKEAQVVLLLTDNETTEQLAAATGAARATDLGVGGIVIGKVLGGAAGWGITNEGKVIAAAFLDAHNKLVVQARALGPTGAAAVGGGPGKK